MIKAALFKVCSSLGRTFRSRGAKYFWVPAAAALPLILISCETFNPALIAPPPDIPGATIVGSEVCADCHEEIVRDFRTADHSRLEAKGKNAEGAGCESCHGPGSLHVSSGGGARTIINPRKDPQACFKCHLDVRAKFNLPYRHAVLEGRVSCSDCHDPHKGSARRGGGTNMLDRNEVCFQCHIAQRGPFVFQHEAMREGCTTCHDPHGSVNQKMLVARNAMLCLKCHFQTQSVPGQASTPGQIMIGGSPHGGAAGLVNSRLLQGTCWSAECHQAVHGSQVNPHLRY